MSFPQTIALIGSPSQTAFLDERIRQTFERQPLLMGFTLEQDLSSAHVELAQCADQDWSELVYAQMLLELSALLEDLGEHRAALLAGRTFARALH